MNIQKEKDPKYWKYKTFYYNKEDERTWVDKYGGNGMTLNMANKNSYWFVAAIFLPLIVILLVVVLIVLFKK